MDRSDSQLRIRDPTNKKHFCFYENFQSHSWEEKVGTPMHLIKEQEWKAILEKSGFFGVKTWRVNPSKDWKGTLVITGKTK